MYTFTVVARVPPHFCPLLSFGVRNAGSIRSIAPWPVISLYFGVVDGRCRIQEAKRSCHAVLPECQAWTAWLPSRVGKGGVAHVPRSCSPRGTEFVASCNAAGTAGFNNKEPPTD